MIIQTTRISRESGIAYLARHLLDKIDENEAIQVLAGDRSALEDAQAIANLKGCRYSVRHLSISPEMPMSPSQLAGFLRAVDEELNIGPYRQRLIVLHSKDGRTHFHAVFGEVDPITFKVLDCRQDFARLERLAREYEHMHSETVQPSRGERKSAKVEGFSDVARKRAERAAPSFDRSKLKTAFIKGPQVFEIELSTQGLRLTDGEKGPILVTADGKFVSAANRAVGVKREEFKQFMKGTWNGQSIGSQECRTKTTVGSRTQYDAPPAAAEPSGSARWARSDRTADGVTRSNPRREPPSRVGIEVGIRQNRSIVATLMKGRYREEWFLRDLGKLSLDDILRRALEMAAWTAALFESHTQRLSRHIVDAKKRKLFPPAAVMTQASPTHDFKRRTL